MQDGKSLKSDVLRKVERLVCDCVNDTFAVFTMGRHYPVSVCALYDGVTNIPLTRRIARCAVFVVAHDRFGVPYNEIERHSGICAGSIMKAVRKYKNIPASDDIVCRVNELIEVELKKFPIT